MLKRMKKIEEKKAELQLKNEQILEEEKNKLESYRTFLSSEYMTWLLEVLNTMVIDLEDKNNDILLSVIEDYIDYKGIPETYFSRGKSIYREIAIKYFDCYGLIMTNQAQYNDEFLPGSIINLTSVPEQYVKEHSREVIDMEELTKYVIDTLDQKEGRHNEIDEAITNLKSRGVSSKEIMDLLQAGYAKVANEEISKRR